MLLLHFYNEIYLYSNYIIIKKRKKRAFIAFIAKYQWEINGLREKRKRKI